jgi:hypothetical protein
MRLHKSLLVALPLLALALVPIRDAAACGGCFPDLSQVGQTQVSGHRMVLSISKTKTTLWDQITYAGDPQSFAWVLPIKGTVDVGVSSDAFFGNLEQLTQVNVLPPRLSCAGPPSCGNAGANAGAIIPPDFDMELGPGGVSVIAQEVVGPYDTVQLSSKDPAALKTWLSDHNFTIPDDIVPTINDYVAEDFNFLAIKLVPGQGVKSMKPVRVTTSGASPVLPLRMVAAGAGATVPITLWVLGEGKYVPSNFPSFTITEDQLVWDWDKNEDNYASVRQDGFTGTSNKGWLIEAGERLDSRQLTGPLLNLITNQPDRSGYGDGMSLGPVEAAGADIDAMLAGIDLAALTVTRLRADLGKEALATDLNVEAASDQGVVKRTFQITRTVGKTPTCPTYPPCSGPGSGGCAYSTSGDAGAFAALSSALLSLGLVIARRRRRADRAISP